MRNTNLRIGLALLGGLLVASSSADVVTLKDGSRLVGDAKLLGPDKFVIATNFAGVLEIERDQIESISTDQPINVEMETGDRLVGPLTWMPETNEAIVVTQFGDVSVPADQINTLWPEGEPSPQERASTAAMEKLREEYESRLPDWTLVVEAGGSHEEGNTEQTDIFGSVVLERKTPKDLLRFFAEGRYGEDDGVRDTSEAKLGTYYEYQFNHWFAYGRNSFEYDEFENLELRSEIAGGLGYYFIREDKHELKGRGGLGYIHESFFDGSTDNNMFVDLGYDYRLDLQEWLRFNHSGTYQPTFDSLNDYRLEFDTGVLIPIARDERVALKFGVEHEYDAQPEPGVERLDTRYYGNIVFTLD